MRIRTQIHRGVYVSLILIGIALTMLSMMNRQSASDTAKNLYSALCNLGTGVLASGVIAWFLDTMNARMTAEIVSYKRGCVLRDVKACVHSFLNESANKYFDLSKVAYGKSIEPRTITVGDLFGTVKEFEKTFLHRYGNKQLSVGDRGAWVCSLYGRESSMCLLQEVAEKILSDADTYIMNGVLFRDEVEMLDAVREAGVRIRDLAAAQDYVGAVAYVDMFYGTVQRMIASIDELKGFGRMVFLGYTIRDASRTG